MNRYLIKTGEDYSIIQTNQSNPKDVIKQVDEDTPIDLGPYIDESEDIDVAKSAYLVDKAANTIAEDIASRIKDEFDVCDYLVGTAAVICFGTTNVDAMNADKDTISEILKGSGYLVGSGFKARRDIPSESIVKGQVLNTQVDLERYAASMWQLILDYGQERVILMADRDNKVEAIENE